MKQVILIATIFGLAACSGGERSSSSSDSTKKEEAGAQSSDGTELDGSDPDTTTTDTTISDTPAEKPIPDYPVAYCSNVNKVDVREDVALEVSYYCQYDKPTKNLLEMRQALLKKGKGKLEIRKVSETHNEDDTTDIVMAWAYYVDIRPFEVKSRPLYEYIAKDYKTDDIDLKSQTQVQSDLDHGLHLWSAAMDYDLTVKATTGVDLHSTRATQYNMYQVLSGDEEMGFGVESMTDTDNPDYIRSIMINLSMNDGTGYNDGVGGALIFNLLHIKLHNRGFPETASFALGEIGAYMAQSMYDGLTGE